MKKAIRALILVLTCVLTFSCTKEDMLSIALSGRWQMIKIESTIDSVPLEPVYFTGGGNRTYWEFNPDQVFVKEVESSLGFMTVKGTWVMDGEYVVITTPDNGTIRYYVEKARLSDLILRDTYDDELHRRHVDIITFKK